MHKRYRKYIIVLVSALLCSADNAFCQQPDSSAAAVDTVKQEEVEDSTANLTGTLEDTLKTTLYKFSLKEEHPVARERLAPLEDWKKLTADKEFWYANKPVPPDAPPATWWGMVFWIVFWVAAAALLVGVVVICMRVFGGSSSAKGKIIAPAGEEEAAEENIFTRDFDSLIARAVNAQDYRLATRLLFLRLLRTLAEKNIIQYSMEKTNLDYLFELGSSRYVRDFSTIARNYEYVWYGHFDIQQNQFAQLRQRLDALNRDINN